MGNKNYWLVYVTYKKDKKKPKIEVMEDLGEIKKNGKRLPKGLRKRIKKSRPKYKKLLKQYH